MAKGSPSQEFQWWRGRFNKGGGNPPPAKKLYKLQVRHCQNQWRRESCFRKVLHVV